MSLPLPLRPLACAISDCTFPDGGTCAEAAQYENPLGNCPNLAREDAVAASSESLPLPEEPLRAITVTRTKEHAAPWAGRHLDHATANQLLWRSPARLIAVAGPHNAGKTCLLASLFVQLASGQCSELAYRFASSRTLYGLHELLEHIQAWDNHEGRSDGRMVPHTPKESGSVRFLHLGLCPKAPGDRRHVDILLSDVAGEWFTEFTRLADDEMRAQMAFMERCDGFVVVADAEALMAKSGAGKQDADTALMLRRIADLAAKSKISRQRSLVLVFSKYDRVVQRVMPPARDKRRDRDAWGELGKRCPRIFSALDTVKEHMPVAVLPVSAFPGPLAQGQPVGVDAPFSFIMHHADRRDLWPRRLAPVPEGAGSFLAMRRWSDQP